MVMAHSIAIGRGCQLGGYESVNENSDNNINRIPILTLFLHFSRGASRFTRLARLFVLVSFLVCLADMSDRLKGSVTCQIKPLFFLGGGGISLP